MPQPEFALPTVGALEPAPGPIPYPQDAGACSVKSIERSETGGLTIFSHDGTKYLVNKEDENEIPQVYVGNSGDKNHVCITCEEKENGPKASKFKMQPHWSPSDEWIILAVEQEKYDKPWWATKDIVEGWLQSGIWVDMFAVRADGSEWHKLQDFGPGVQANGFVGTPFTADGNQAVWAQIVDGNVFAYSFGRWELILADYQEVNGVPSFVNLRDITPADTFWVEPGNFAPDSNDLLLSADTGFPDHSKVQGQDQYILNIDSGEITNLTNTPVIWDEHGVFSPDGKKVFFMTSYSYPEHSTVFSLKTEFMMMDRDGSNLQRVTYFNQPGFPEYDKRGGVAAVGAWHPNGQTISAINLFFPKYEVWDITFQRNCGANY